MVKLKICGLTRGEDVDAVNASPPDYIGFVFAKHSRRRVTFEQAEKLSLQLSRLITPVGVFVNSPIEEIIYLYRRGVIKIAQLHGGETMDYFARLNAAGIPTIQAIREGHGDTLEECADYYLFDGTTGGSGTAREWADLPAVRKPIFLAGGICMDNISTVLAIEPFAVDISSGAETDGRKDAKKIKALVERVRLGKAC